MSRYIVTTVSDKYPKPCIVKLPITSSDFTWRGYHEDVKMTTWKPGSGTPAIRRVVKEDRPKHRGIRYNQFSTREQTWKDYVYKDRIEGQTFYEFPPVEFN